MFADTIPEAKGIGKVVEAKLAEMSVEIMIQIPAVVSEAVDIPALEILQVQQIRENGENFAEGEHIKILTRIIMERRILW